MREQRKLAAVLAADAVGYSRLMGRDEAGTLARLKEHRAQRLEPALQRNGGRLVKLTGDGALAEFPSAVDALRAAIEFQKTVDEANAQQAEDERIVFRIGLHIGDLIVDGDDLYGDGMNIAARLEGEAPPGGIVVSGALHEATAGKLQAHFVDLGRLALKNIERPVQAYRVEREGDVSPATGSVAPLPLPDKPSIAVLPFQNMSGDAEQEYFVDGMAEDITTALSRFRSLFVIARNSSFSYKGKSPDVRQVGRELGVRYVLEGSVRKAANRIRVTGQLIDTLTGNHIWAERYDRVLEDIFAVQEEVTQAIVAAIAPQITSAERAKAARRRPSNLSAYEIALRAWVHSGEGHDKIDHALIGHSLREAREALSIDATSVLALQALVRAHGTMLFLQIAPDPEHALREAASAISRAIELDDQNPYSYAQRANLSMQRGRPDAEGLADARRAHEMNPNDVEVLKILGTLETAAGDPQRALEHLHQVMRLDPRASRNAWTYSLLAFAYLGAKQYHEGVDWALRALRDMPRMVQPHVNLVGCLVGTGEIGKAKATLEAGQRLAPEFFRTRLEGSMSPFARPEDGKRLQMFLRIAAGLEDPSVAEAFR
jgi:adenylate cyclase